MARAYASIILKAPVEAVSPVEYRIAAMITVSRKFRINMPMFPAWLTNQAIILLE